MDELVKRRFDGLMILERISGTKVALTIDCYFDLASNRLVEGITMRQICIKILLGVGFLLVIHEISHTASQPTDSMTRGKYIVDHVAMCVECHTPRNDKGEILSGQYLKGAPIPLNPPPYPNIKWAIKAPGIVGLVGYTRQQGIRLLTEGITSDGRIPNPPMPRFRLTRSDAEAVVDYLKSLQ